ncbi:hypothetical protein [Azospirillum halopraeferens]|uniref:hypothetical protein n=1 Tax=Azospirillum halopraeferens TaxID=34010 RepID=UPI00040EEC98|nr:hypothetical protein [Azospirillum halopraeferens]
MQKTLFAAAFAAALSLSGPLAAAGITADEVAAAQKIWAEGIVAIGAAHTGGQDYKSAAIRHIDTLYAYDSGPVLFKPTKAAVDQFRETKQQALDYFIGAAGTEDTGFAITPWTAVRFENHGIATVGDGAVAMGNYYFTDTAGTETKVEYTFGYIRDANGALRINVHHSSLPYPKP